jgi:hypothetical protein
VRLNGRMIGMGGAGIVFVLVTTFGLLVSAEPQPPAADITFITPSSSPNGSIMTGPAALDVLAQLPVKGRSGAPYDRDAQYGPGWADPPGPVCDTRTVILRRDAFAWSGARSSCRIDTITVIDPYSGAELRQRADIDIDHVVALGDAADVGADYPGVPADVAQTRREALANDPRNLLAVDARLNRQKGDGDAATWLPPAKGYRCAYVARIIAVKAAYGLWVTPPEYAAMVRVLESCPGQPTPLENE